MEFPSYTYPCDRLHTGASLGNRRAFARLDRATRLLGLWCSLDNQFYAGEWHIDLEADGELLMPSATTFLPESQMTSWRNGAFEADLLFFLPLLKESSDVLQSAHFLLTLRNIGRQSVTITVRQHVTFPGVISSVFTKQPAEDQLAKRVDVVYADGAWQVITRDRDSEARVLGCSLPPEQWSCDDRGLTASHTIDLAPGAERSAHFTLAFSPHGVQAAEAIFESGADGTVLLQQTRDAHCSMLATLTLHTPDPLINRGFFWAKVNTLRVQHEYRAGLGFTNDPPQDIVVIRDLAWYVLGADYLTPGFSRGLIELAERLGYHAGGKLTEFLHADEAFPVQHDYNLNINDDTPLFVLALWHHALAEGGSDALPQFYPLMRRAADWIISQRKNGLVYAIADGTNVWGICSWRNIIDNYNLTGAVTEINAECCHALQLTAKAALVSGKRDEAEYYETQAEALRRTIQEQLVSRRTGTYLLTLRNGGIADHTITGDLVFPVMFAATEGEARERAIQYLLSPALWTPFGVRTVHPDEPAYDPDFGYQLVGGVWPNLTAWVAFAARDRRPGIVAEAMRNVYRQSESERPADYANVVPGEFPERLHGETFVSRGMAMSPWMPATYLWLGVEGLLGFAPGLDGAALHPFLPEGWRWIAVKNLPFRQETISLFVYEGTAYISSPLVRSNLPARYGSALKTTPPDGQCVVIALLLSSDVVVFVGSDSGTQGTVVVHLPSGPHSFDVHLNAGDARFYKFDAATFKEKEAL